MKNYLVSFILIPLLIPGFTGDPVFEYSGRPTPSIKMEKIYTARFINDIMPGFYNYVILPFSDRMLLETHLRAIDGFYSSPQANYNRIIDFIAVEISATCQGKPQIAHSTGELLSRQQKNILNTVDPGSDIRITIKFRYKNQATDFLSRKELIQEGLYIVTAVPQTEAEYKGGYDQFSEYLTRSVLNKISTTNDFDKIRQAGVRFMVNEKGQIVNVLIYRSSTDLALDKLLQDAITKMPEWSPAKNLLGMTISQVFYIPMSEGC